MSRSMEILRRCRVCLHSSTAKREIFVDLTHGQDQSKTPGRDALEVFDYLGCFNKFTQLQLTLQQLLLEQEAGGECAVCHYLCRSCSGELMRAHEFVRQARENHKWLQDQMQERVKGKPPDDHTLELLQILKTEDTFNEELKSEAVVEQDDALSSDIDQAVEYLLESETEDPLTSQRDEQLVTLAVEAVCDDRVEVDEHELCDIIETNDEKPQLPVEENEMADIDFQPWEIEKNESGEKKKFFEFNCELCTDKYEFQRDLMQHYQQDHDAASLPFPCNSCSYRFATKDTLRLHVRCIHELCEYVDCQHCGRSVLASFHELHMKRHRQPLKYLCSKCPNSYASKYTLQKHLDAHANERERDFECGQCERKFYRLDYLQMHLAIHQDPGKRTSYNCTLCTKTFLRQSNLRLHMQMHRGETIDCKYCGKHFVRRKDLEIHVRFHTGDFPYMCHICGRKFAIRSHLKSHEKRHTGERYECTYCGKDFVNLSGLSQHSYRHTGMPLTCNICQRGFPTRFKMRRHLRSVHHSVFDGHGGYTDALSDQYITKRKKSRAGAKRGNSTQETEEYLKIEELIESGEGEEEFIEDTLSAMKVKELLEAEDQEFSQNELSA